MRIGLVLAGGIAKGAYQIGALRAINEYLSPADICCVSCSSVGVLNGYAFTTGKLDEATRIWQSIAASNTRIPFRRLIQSTSLQGLISSIYSDDDRLNCNFYETLLNSREMTVLYQDLSVVERSMMRDYLRASVTMPLFNYSVPIGGEQYYDGAFADNIPVYPLLKHKLDYMLCVHFDNCSYTYESPCFNNKIINISFDEDSLGCMFSFKESSIHRMMDEGFSKTTQILEQMFANGTEDLDYIYSQIRRVGTGERKLRLTEDVCLINLNKLAKRITTRRLGG